MIYTATITSASLRLRESRIVAGLLLQGAGRTGWTDAIVHQDVLRLHNAVSAARVGGLLRARLEPLGDGLWEMVRDGGREQATQAVFAGAVKNSRLLGDFMDIVMREQRALFGQQLERRMWSDYIEGCRGRDPDMPHWSEKTVARLRSAVFSMLCEAGYLRDARSLAVQNVFVDARLAGYLRERGEAYVLRCLEVAE